MSFGGGGKLTLELDPVAAEESGNAAGPGELLGGKSVRAAKGLHKAEAVAGGDGPAGLGYADAVCLAPIVGHERRADELLMAARAGERAGGLGGRVADGAGVVLRDEGGDEAVMRAARADRVGGLVGTVADVVAAKLHNGGGDEGQIVRSRQCGARFLDSTGPTSALFSRCVALTMRRVNKVHGYELILILRACRDRVRRGIRRADGAAVLGVGDDRGDEGLLSAVGAGDCVGGRVDAFHSVAALMRKANDEGALRLDHVAVDALGDAGKRGLGERADALRLFGLRAGEKDRGAGQGKIEALGDVAPGLHRRRGDRGRGVRLRRPDDGAPIAPGHEIEPLPNRGGAVVTGANLAPLHRVAAATERADETPEKPPLAAGDGLALGIERAPSLKFLDVFEKNHAGRDGVDPVNDDPREAANVLGPGLAALGLGEVLAVGAEPDAADWPAAGDLQRIGGADVLAIVDRLRVIHPVHREGLAVVVERGEDGEAEGAADAGGGTAAAGEVIDEDFSHGRWSDWVSEN